MSQEFALQYPVTIMPGQPGPSTVPTEPQIITAPVQDSTMPNISDELRPKSKEQRKGRARLQKGQSENRMRNCQGHHESNGEYIF